MKKLQKLIIALATGIAVQQSQAAIIVNDTWIDGTRNDPNPLGGFSENGVDADGDGDIESAWFKGPSGFAVSVVNPTPGITPGIIRGAMPASGSASFTTYFTPSNTAPVTLTTAGQKVQLTWAFSMTGINSATTAQALRLGIVDWPEASVTRIATDTAPSSANLAVFPGYSMQLNINTTLANSNPFQLVERSVTPTTFLANAAGWSFLDDEETSGVPGYQDGVVYTFTFSAMLNGLGGLDIESSMTGGNLGGDGSLNVSFTDTTPNSLTFDTFGIRANTLAETASVFDTSLFRVELIEAAPEPTVLSLGLLGALGLAGFRRRPRQ
jgi:hypothetical protein